MKARGENTTVVRRSRVEASPTSSPSCSMVSSTTTAITHSYACSGTCTSLCVRLYYHRYFKTYRSRKVDRRVSWLLLLQCNIILWRNFEAWHCCWKGPKIWTESEVANVGCLNNLDHDESRCNLCNLRPKARDAAQKIGMEQQLAGPAFKPCFLLCRTTWIFGNLQKLYSGTIGVSSCFVASFFVESKLVCVLRDD